MKREAFQEVSILHLMSHGEPVSPTRKARRRLVAHKCTTNNDSLSTTQVRPYFYVTDYLGSVRMVCDGITGVVRQSLEYLPSGYVFRSDNYAEQPYMFCGKELVKMHGINLYDSNARFQHKDLPRFTSIDPLAEKYYSLSPYNYAGNDPVNAADPSGQIIVHVVDGVRYTFKCVNMVFGFYDKDNNLYSGNDEYMQELASSLFWLMQSDTGRWLVSCLMVSSNEVNIISSSGNNSADAYEVYWNPKNTFVGADITGGKNVNKSVILGHELAHVWDKWCGTENSEAWVNEPGIPFIPMSEMYACHIENMIRFENSIPLRKYYMDIQDYNPTKLVEIRHGYYYSTYINPITGKPYKYGPVTK